jgi:hypothetical protein
VLANVLHDAREVAIFGVPAVFTPSARGTDGMSSAGLANEEDSRRVRVMVEAAAERPFLDAFTIGPVIRRVEDSDAAGTITRRIFCVAPAKAKCCHHAPPVPGAGTAQAVVLLFSEQFV